MPNAANTAQWSETKGSAVAIASPLYAVYDAALDMWGWSEVPPADGAVVFDYLAGFHAVNEFETESRQALAIGSFVVHLPPEVELTLFRYIPGFVLLFATFERASTAFQFTPTELTLLPIDEPRDAHYIGIVPHLLMEPAGTNVVLHSRDLTNAVWTKTNCAAVKDQTGADEVANSASKLTATAANATCLQAITLASSARYQSAYLKRVTGSGVVEMTMDNGATWTAVAVTASWRRIVIPTQALANPTVGFRIVTSGDVIAVDLVQNEDGTFPSTPIATTTASVTRSADAITDWGASFASQAVTQYERYYDLPTQAYLDGVVGFTGTTPNLPTTDKAYTHIQVATGTLTLAEMRDLAGVT